MAFHTLNPPYSYTSVRSYLGRILSDSSFNPSNKPVKQEEPTNLRRSMGPGNAEEDNNAESGERNVHHSDDDQGHGNQFEDDVGSNRRNRSSSSLSGEGAYSIPMVRRRKRLEVLFAMFVISFCQQFKRQSSTPKMPVNNLFSISEKTKNVPLLPKDLLKYQDHDEMEKLLRQKLLEEKTRNEQLTHELKARNDQLTMELRMKNESISELESKLAQQQKEMERMRKLLYGHEKK